MTEKEPVSEASDLKKLTMHNVQKNNNHVYENTLLL
jgi:hypothetical protein